MRITCRVTSEEILVMGYDKYSKEGHLQEHVEAGRYGVGQEQDGGRFGR